ncbi:MAG: class I SAM-dependent methyltransferase [Actinomycetota bacterium]
MKRSERNREVRRIRKLALASEKFRPHKVRVGDGIELHHRDFRNLDLPPKSVDLIFTDPPYDRDYPRLWDELGDFAARALKPGCLLVSYAGNRYLRDVWDRLSSHLDFVVLGGLYMAGNCHSRDYGAQVIETSKSLLFFSAGSYEPRRFFRNGHWAEKPEKTLHVWQQEISCARYYVETLTEPGQLVVDPLLGSGTDGLACLELGRRFVGCDIDEDAVRISTERLAPGGSQRIDLPAVAAGVAETVEAA